MNYNDNLILNGFNNNNNMMNNFIGNNNMMMIDNSFNRNNSSNLNLNNFNGINNNININNMNNISNLNNFNNMNFNNMNNLIGMSNMNNFNNFASMTSMNNYNMNNFNNINNMTIINNLSEQVQDLSDKVKEILLDKNQLSNNSLKSRINLEEEIIIIFRFLSGQEQKVKAKLYEIFYEVFKRFNSQQCPPELKDYMCYAYHNAELIDNNKTLFENGIKNGESVFFLRINENNKKEENIDEENDEDEEEKNKVYKIWMQEFECIKKNYPLLSENEEGKKFNLKFTDFLEKKLKELGMKIKEHKHKLIYCKTNLNWTCNECNKEKPKAEPRLFCSICNYNMCNYCRKSKQYYKIGNIPLSALPSNNTINNLFIYPSGHEHRLAYCMTKRSSYYLGWFCNKCREKFNGNVWTFYCTKCDYDLCSNCAKNENLI